jgi:hypothetical protein
MSGVITLLHNTPSFRGAQLKEKAQGQLHLFLEGYPNNTSSKSKTKFRGDVWVAMCVCVCVCRKVVGHYGLFLRRS